MLCSEIFKPKKDRLANLCFRYSFFSQWVVPWGVNHKKHNVLKIFSHLVSFVELSMLIILVKKNSMIARLLFEILPKYRQNLPKTSNQGFRYFRYRIVYNRENLTYSYIKMIGMKSSTTYTVLKSIDHHHH